MHAGSVTYEKEIKNKTQELDRQTKLKKCVSACI